MNYFKSRLLASISLDKLEHIDVGIHVHSSLYLKIMCKIVLTYVVVLGESAAEEKLFLKLQNREIVRNAFTFMKRKREKMITVRETSHTAACFRTAGITSTVSGCGF